jgi:hypothetical protein
MLTHCALADYNGTLNGNTVRTTILLLVTKQLGVQNTLDSHPFFNKTVFIDLCGILDTSFSTFPD